MNPPSLREVRTVLGLAVAVSVVHYVDNYVRFDDYLKDPGTPITPAVVVVSWVAFTVVAVLGYRALRQGRTGVGAWLLGLYSLSGLVGLGHYKDAPPSSFDPVQNVLIVTDIALGLAVLVVAVRLARARPRPLTAPAGRA